MAGQSIELNNRERATLRAVGRGPAEIICSCLPDLFIDGLACCDQFTAHRLARLSLIVPQRSGRLGERVPAMLADAAHAVLARVDR